MTQVLFLVTDAVLHQVFEPQSLRYGYHVVELRVFQGATQVEAIVQLRSRHEATQGRDALNDRAIYDGCCFINVDYSSLSCTTPAVLKVHNEVSLTPSGATECHDKGVLTPSSKLKVAPKADLTKAARYDWVPAPDSMPEDTSVLVSTASTTSALTTDKEKMVMEILAEIKATLDRVLAKADVSLPPLTLTAAWSTMNSAAPEAGFDSPTNSHGKCPTPTKHGFRGIGANTMLPGFVGGATETVTTTAAFIKLYAAVSNETFLL